MTEEEARKETIKHIEKVRIHLSSLMLEMGHKSREHDATKLKDPEFKIFLEYTPKLRNTTYGSDEYKGYLKEMQVALDHHYSHNRHHPEHFKNGIKDMDLIDLCEMICDWLAATERHADGDIQKSLEINQKRFGYGDELKEIMRNTVKLLQGKQDN